MNRNPWPLRDPTAPRPAGALPAFYVSGQDVENHKNEVDAMMTSVGNDVAQCAAMTAGDRAAWAAFYADWRKFYCLNDSGTCAGADSSFWNTVTQYQDTDTWATNLQGWQNKVTTAGCKNTVAIPPPPDPGADLSSALHWGTVLAGILLAGYVVKEVGLPRVFGGTKGQRR